MFVLVGAEERAEDLAADERDVAGEDEDVWIRVVHLVADIVRQPGACAALDVGDPRLSDGKDFRGSPSTKR